MSQADSGTVLANIALLTGYAEILTLDRPRAHAVVRETLYLEVFGRVEEGWLQDRMSALRCLRSVFYAYHCAHEQQGRAAARRRLAAAERIYGGSLGCALEELEVADRELLFLRFAALLGDGEIAELTGRDEADVGARLEHLCRTLPYDRAIRRAQDRLEPIAENELPVIHAHLVNGHSRRPHRGAGQDPSTPG